MKRRLYKTYIRTRNLNRRARDLITPAGTMVIVVFVVALLFGNNPDKNFIYQITMLSLSVLLVSLLFSLYFRTAVRVTPSFPEKCSVGDRVSYYIELENRGDITEDGLFYSEQLSNIPLSLEAFLTGKEEGEEQRNKFDRTFGYYRWTALSTLKDGVVPKLTPLPRLLPNEKKRVELFFTPLRRGYIHFAGFALFRSDPFGLFRRKIAFEMPTNIVVYPAVFPLSVEQLTGVGLIRSGFGSETDKKGHSGDFLSLREYVPGDPVKQIDWKSTAKGDPVIFRELQKESQARMTIFVDTVSSISTDSLVEDALSYASSLVVSATAAVNIEDVVTSEHFFSARTGSIEAKKERLLEALATVQIVPHSENRAPLHYISTEHNAIGAAIVLLISLSPSNLNLLRELSLVRLPFSALLFVDRATVEIKQRAEKEGVRVIEKGSWHSGGLQ